MPAPSAAPSPQIPFSIWWLARALVRHPGWFVRLGNLESSLFQEQLDPIVIDRPIFICGLARSGTTITLELLTSLDGVVSHRYQDFPCVHLPLAWNRALGGDARKTAAPVERLHGDGIYVTSASPEAIEEPLWMSFFPQAHDPRVSNLLPATLDRPEFARFYRRNLQKILMLRGGRRIAVKGNYLLSRLPYLARLFPDARFIVLVREPLEHVASLARQQRIFAEAQRTNARAQDYLRALGHFEFGLDRRPINMGDDAVIEEILARWARGEELAGSALYWRHLYGSLSALLAEDEDLARRVAIVRFETLYGEPAQTLRRLLDHCGLDADAPPLESLAARLKPPRLYRPDIPAGEAADVARICAPVASLYGYA
ncbi:MAG TPA: sulfotransferase [Aliidongia sp.]|nr:sulfotransferase [Aliidongia sp.]